MIHPKGDNGELDLSITETIPFLSYQVESYELIEDYSNLNFYVSK